MEQSPLIAGLCCRHSVVGCHERPCRIVMIVRLRRYLRPEYSRSPGRDRHRRYYLLRSVRVRHIPKDGERFSKSLATTGLDQTVPSIKETAIIALVRQPEIIIDCLTKVCRPATILLCHGFFAQFPGHRCHRLEHLRIHHVGTEALRHVYISGLHPQRITLLTPVDERTFSSIQACLGIIQSMMIAFQALQHHGICFPEPLHITGRQIDLPRCYSPDDTVARTWPRPAGAGILDNTSQFINLHLQRRHDIFRNHIRKRKDGTITDIPGPYTAPKGSCPESSVLFDIIDHLVNCEIVQSGLQSRISLEHAIL